MKCKCEPIKTYPTGLFEGEYYLRHAPWCNYEDGLVTPEGHLPSASAVKEGFYTIDRIITKEEEDNKQPIWDALNNSDA